MNKGFVLSCAIVMALGIVFSTPAFAQTVTFEPLGVTCGPPFFPRACVVDMSGDGKAILFQNALWTEAGGMEPIGGPPLGFQTVAISDDGKTVVGTIAVDDPPLGRRNEAAIWMGGDEWRSLGGLPGAGPCGVNFTSSFDVSGDGSTVVGLAWIGVGCADSAQAYRRTEATGMVDMGSIVEGRASRFNAISADGSTPVGWSDTSFGSRLGAIYDDVDGWSWFEPDGSDLFVGEAQGVNSDGTVVVGGGFTDSTSPASFFEPWIWTEATGVQSLGAAKGLRGLITEGQHIARDVSDDGKTVIGQVTLFLLGEQWAWISTEDQGMEMLQDFVARRGDAATAAMMCKGGRGPVFPCNNGWDFWNTSAISNDGKTIVGTGVNPDTFVFEAFRITIP